MPANFQLTHPRLLGLGSIMGLALLLTACSGSGPETTTNLGSDPSATHIKVGVLVPLTGPYAWVGDRVRTGYTLAQEDLAKEGIATELVFEDSTCINAKKAVDSFQKLLEFDRVAVFVGPHCGSPVEAVKPLMERAKRIFVSPWGSATPSKDHYFSMAITIPDESAAITRFAQKRQAKTAAIYHYLNDWGQAHRDNLLREFPAQGIKVVFVGSFSAEVKDYRTELIKIKQANPDVVFVAASGTQFGDVIRQTRELGLTNTILGQYGVEDKSTIAAAGDALEGVYYTYPDFPTTEKGRWFYEEHNRRFGNYPATTEPQAYDALMIAARAVKQCGKDDKDGSTAKASQTDPTGGASSTTSAFACQKALLANLDGYQAASGAIKYDQQTQRYTRNVIIKTVKDGKFLKLSETTNTD